MANGYALKNSSLWLLILSQVGSLDEESHSKLGVAEDCGPLDAFVRLCLSSVYHPAPTLCTT